MSGAANVYEYNVIFTNVSLNQTIRVRSLYMDYAKAKWKCIISKVKSWEQVNSNLTWNAYPVNQ